MTFSRRIRAGWVGRLSYDEGLERQAAAAGRLKTAAEPGREDETLLLLEHPHVITIGRNASDLEVLAPQPVLEGKGVSVVRCDRGGRTTYHGPGQLVGYPILDLRPDRRDVGRYMNDLEEALIRTLDTFGIAAGRFPGHTGVWVDIASPDACPEALAGDGRIRTRERQTDRGNLGPPSSVRKIAALGVHIARWITTHGFALNVNPDLSYFGLIVPCGITEYGVTSMSEILGREIEVDEVAARFVPSFCDVFDRVASPID